jgi:hypothetical protein
MIVSVMTQVKIGRCSNWFVLFWFVKDGKDEMINLMLIDNDK